MKRSLNSFHDGKTGAAITLVLKYGKESTKATKIEKDGTVDIDLVSAMPGADADKELLRFLSEILTVPEKNFDVLAGSDEKKLISIVDISPEEVDQILHKLL